MKAGFSAILLAVFFVPGWCGAAAPPAYLPSALTPPPVRREFRGAWVATVGNIDWPSKPGLPTDQQKSELLDILNHAVQLNLNAIVLQVRPACDALYPSKLEPWSYYLTGAMGKPPNPYYDPLEFAVTEAHRRGLELHAWFNPYRALHASTKPPISPDHISRTRPGLVREYGDLLWLDPGEHDVQDHSVRVVMDVVKRYDIDGIQFDDYFYPYRQTIRGTTNLLEFPDDASWQKFGAGRGLSRDDWRRENVNAFVQRVYESVKSVKPWVKVGISPFGIWQPGYPGRVTGLNAYTQLYCDSRKWLVNGWLDYCAPQLYWSIQSKSQSYPDLLAWWEGQNPKRRHIWPGINTVRVGAPSRTDAQATNLWAPAEIVRQINLTREQPEAGVIHWNMGALLHNRGGIATVLRREVYAGPALVPPSPWLDREPPGRPKLSIRSGKRLKWDSTGLTPVYLWLLQTKSGGQWTSTILPSATTTTTLTNAPEAIALTAIDRCGVSGVPVVLARQRPGGH